MSDACTDVTEGRIICSRRVDSTRELKTPFQMSNQNSVFESPYDLMSIDELDFLLKLKAKEKADLSYNKYKKKIQIEDLNKEKEIMLRKSKKVETEIEC